MSLNLGNFSNAYADMPTLSSVGGKKVEVFTNKCIHQRKCMVNCNPSTSVQANIWNSGQIDFRIEEQIDRIAGNGVWLRIGYSNTSGAACVLAPVNAWLNQIQVYSNNGSTLIYQQLSNMESFVINHLVMSRDEYENLAYDAYRSDANYTQTTISVANGESGYFYLPLCPLFWKSTHLRPYSINGNLLIRLTFNPASINISSGSLTCTEAVLRISGYMESADQKKLVLSKATLPKQFFYYSVQRHIENMTLAASSVYNIRLSGITGHVNQLVFVIRSAADSASPNAQFSFSRPASFEILDENNVSLTGFTPVSDTEMVLNYAHQYPNKFILHNNLNVHSFSQTPIGDLALGTINGVQHFNGFCSLRFTTRSTLVGGAYTVTVIALCNETLTIMNGNAYSTRT
jgi:hypothetical protein